MSTVDTELSLMIYQHTLAIIPAINEAKTIAGVVDRIIAMYPGMDIAVIDDGSTDGTGAIARKAGAFVLLHPYQMGYGSSIQTGYKYAWRHGYKFLVQLDGDGQHDPLDIAPLIAPVYNETCDLAIGSRFLGGNSYSPSLPRRCGILFFRLLLRLFLSSEVTDPTSGFQAMNRRTLNVFRREYFPTDYPDADVLILLHKQQLKFIEVAVTMHENRNGTSMHNNPLMALYYLYKMVISMFLTQFRTLPLENDPCR